MPDERRRVRFRRGHAALRSLLFLGLLLSLLSGGEGTEEVSLLSPGKSWRLLFQLEESGTPFCLLTYRGKQILKVSAFGLLLEGKPPLAGNFVLRSVRRSSHAATRSSRLAECSTWPDRYNQVTVSLRERSRPYRRLDLLFRAYEEGVAFRYVVPEQAALEEVAVQGETTIFTFSFPCRAYAEYGHEGEYRLTPIGQLRGRCELPLLVVDRTAGLYHLLCHGDLRNWSRGFVTSAGKSGRSLKWVLASSVRRTVPLESPFHVIRSAERPGEILQTSYLLYNLCPERAFSDTSWIVPGKAMRVLPVTTEAAKEVIDFAAQNGITYAELDAGWYGPERDRRSDARTYLPQINVEEVAAYGARKGVGLLLYVNKIHLKRQLDALLPIYRRWGIRGLKFGFVDGRTHRGVSDVHTWVRKAALYRMVVDIHDNYRPTGLSWTFPNLLTQEGVRGNEHMPTSRHNATLPFTRFVVGAADYTFCYLSSRLKTTSAHQLALSVIYFSPLQFVYWYGRPSQYRTCRGKEFFKILPTTWDETRVLYDRVGQYVACARRNGEDWFLGVITNEEARELTICLEFLLPQATYEGTLWRDSSTGEVACARRRVTAQTRLTEKLRPSGGMAAYFRKLR